MPRLRSIHARAAALALLALVAAGCSDLFGSDDDDPIVLLTDASSYDARREGNRVTLEVPTLVVNRTSRTVYLPRCGDAPVPQLQKLQGTAWVTVWAPMCPAIRSDPLVLGPRDKVGIDATILAFDGGAQQPQLGTPVAGTYRLVYAINKTRDQDFDTTFPPEEGATNPFEVEDPQG